MTVDYDIKGTNRDQCHFFEFFRIFTYLLSPSFYMLYLSVVLIRNYTFHINPNDRELVIISLFNTQNSFHISYDSDKRVLTLDSSYLFPCLYV